MFFSGHSIKTLKKKKNDNFFSRFSPCAPLLSRSNRRQETATIPKYSLYPPKYPHTNSPYWYSYISLEISWESLIKDHSSFFLVIIWLILVTICLDNVWILLGENYCWSLLGVKGLNSKTGPLFLEFDCCKDMF